MSTSGTARVAVQQKLRLCRQSVNYGKMLFIREKGAKIAVAAFALAQEIFCTCEQTGAAAKGKCLSGILS